MKITIAGAVALALVVLTACGARTEDTANNDDNGDETSPAHMSVSPSAVAPGGTITVTLMNHSDRQLGYNLCPLALERRADGQWEERQERPAEACTMELRTLESGASATFDHTMPAVPAGTYRFRGSVEWPLGEEQVGVSSVEFEVTG